MDSINLEPSMMPIRHLVAAGLLLKKAKSLNIASISAQRKANNPITPIPQYFNFLAPPFIAQVATPAQLQQSYIFIMQVPKD